jgi:hypothetical protein
MQNKNWNLGLQMGWDYHQKLHIVTSSTFIDAQNFWTNNGLGSQEEALFFADQIITSCGCSPKTPLCCIQQTDPSTGFSIQLLIQLDLH